MDRLGAMEVFIRVFETGSFSGAARQLHIGQPAVSKTMAQLEERLGVKLLLRHARGLTPTEAGQSYYERSKRLIEEVEEADLAARGIGAGLSGRLRFSAAATFARLHVIPRLPLFLAQHPQLKLEAILDDRRVDLMEEGIDVALRMGILADSAMTARKIAKSRRLVLATPDYFAGMGEPSTPSDLLRHEAIIYAQAGGGAAWTFHKGGVQESITLTGRLQISAVDGVREAVLIGLGLFVATEWMFERELRSGAVIEVLRGWELPPVHLWAAFPTGRRATAKARAFAAFLEAQFLQTRFAP